jgi:hypothetical protein
MKKSVAILTIALLLFAMCIIVVWGGSTGSYVIIDDNQAKPTKNTFKLDMDKAEVIKMIRNKNIKIYRDDKHGTEGSSIRCENIRFFFNNKNKAIEIFIYEDKKLITTKGLRIGDNIEKVEKLYGRCGNTHEEMDATVYQYKYKKNFFSIIMTNNIVTGWGVHKFSVY